MESLLLPFSSFNEQTRTCEYRSPRKVGGLSLPQGGLGWASSATNPEAGAG